MKRSGNLVIGRSVDLKSNFIAEVRRSGENKRNSDSYQGTSFSRAITSKNIWASAPAAFINVMQTIRATLREIFDESAYERFLLRTNGTRSIASYRDYMRERDAAMAKKPRCC
jgi:hypothetical protein